MTTPASHDSDHAVPTRCENCAAQLQGHYCHACGQSVVNPVRHVGHALEEVFEAFWHLDGRIFRTLRDLQVPGRVAVNYLSGQRARYVAPLRLFVILAVLTFFVAQFALHVDQQIESGRPWLRLSDSMARMGNQLGAIKNARTVNEVERLRVQAVRDMEKARDTFSVDQSGTRQNLQVSIDGIHRQAERRIEALRQAQSLSTQDIAALKAQGVREAQTVDRLSLETAGTLADVERLRAERLRALQASTAPGRAAEISRLNANAACRITQLQVADAIASEGKTPSPDELLRYGDTDCEIGGDETVYFNNRPWHANTTPVELAWLPQFANRWIRSQMEQGQQKVKRLIREPSRYMRVFLSAVPSALFLLVPVFALLLKLFYLGSGRLYLEHLVVALFSHAWLCLALLGVFALRLLGDAITAHWAVFATISDWLQAALWAWMPFYLLLMQKRVYRRTWRRTVVEWFVLGFVYLFLILIAATFLGIVSMVRM